MNLSKANGLNHTVLATKLKCYGPDQNTVESFRSHLSNRFQRYRKNNILGTLRKDIVDVPQVSQLGPLLFNICKNDTFFFLKNTSLSLYVDCSALYAYNKILETVISRLRQDFSIFTKCLIITTYC